MRFLFLSFTIQSADLSKIEMKVFGERFKLLPDPLPTAELIEGISINYGHSV